MADRQLTLMAVHAHPDDEATSTGGVLAKAAAEGIRTVLVTCTDGCCGDGPGGVKPGEPGHDRDEVVEFRKPELEKSCEILGISHLERLDYHDSGMMGWEANNAPDAFWSTPVEDGAAKLATLIEKYSPDVIVTYDENGFYGHPDHIQAHRITMAAVESTGSKAKVYWGTVPRSLFGRFGDAMKELGVGDWDEELPKEEDGGALDMGLPDDEITTWVDITDYAEQKYGSLQAHASQGENILFLQLGLERFRDLMGIETFVRVRDTTNAPLPEKDLFDGLR